MRKLATVRKIKQIKEHPNADRLELAIVDGWQCIIEKGRYKTGEKVIYCEIDSFLPIKEEFEFLRKSSYKKMGGHEGFRLKTIRLRGELSQGLILPLSLLLPESNFEIGQDVTEMLGIQKYEPPIPAQLVGEIVGYFPSFIKKTDEERVQNLPDLSFFEKRDWYISEKLDGTSCTIFFNKGEFGVCSRNLQLKEDLNNTYWKIAKKYSLKEKMQILNDSEETNFAIQGEIVGEGIQGNKYNIKGQDFFVFNIFDIDIQEYVSKDDMEYIAGQLGLKIVPRVNEILVDFNVDSLLKMADGKSVLNKDTWREGLVFVSDYPNRVSFKVISNKFLEKEKD